MGPVRSGNAGHRSDRIHGQPTGAGDADRYTPPPMSRRIVVTGVGPVTACGVGIDALWSALCEGRTAIDRIRGFDASGYACGIAGEITDEALDIRQHVPKSYRKNLKVMCRDIELAVAGAAAAITDAGLVTRGTDPDATPTIAPDRFGCHIGAGLIAADPHELGQALISSAAADGTLDLHHWGAQGMQNLTPLWLLKYLPNMLACHVTIIHDCRGPSNTITCCEASGALSIGESMRVIRRGAADACLSGGAEDKLNPMAFMRLHFADRLAATAPEDDPASIVRPFSPDARGTVAGAGGAILVLEALDAALGRGARPAAEIVGFAATQNVCPDTVGLRIPAEGETLSAAIRLALSRGGITADEVDAIVPFGSSIPAVDALERHALRTVFGARTPTIPLVTIVPTIGNTHAGSAAVSVAVAARMLRERMLPARLNTAGITDLDANATAARTASLEHVLVLSTSQGGQNAAVLLRRFDA